MKLISARKQAVAVTVADTGCGIPEEQIDNIFDRYFRGDHGQPSSGQSNGLGLAIVRRILELHGSRINVSSTMNQGTRFEFRLPTPAVA